jgi:SpoVK/Ycf46/Vps4 family AAA+-type ATPase
MKQASKAARSAKAPSRPNVRLPAKDIARVGAIAAAVNVRPRSRRKALLLSGTNAGAAAEAMARQLRRNLFRVDLSAVVSKFIGETEKNLARVFAEAGRGTILLLDEADALLGKRTNVMDAHDRFSNPEIDSLLQSIEEYDGLVVLVSKPKLTLPMTLRRRFSVYDFPPLKTAAKRSIVPENGVRCRSL